MITHRRLGILSLTLSVTIFGLISGIRLSQDNAYKPFSRI